MTKVTVGLPTFNRAKQLKRAIEQILTQSFKDFELIIYNDGSNDNTVEVVKSFKDERIIFINEKNKGLPHPLNKILNLAIGEYIIILHDHDIFHPQLLEKSLKALEKYPDAGFVLQGSAWIDENDQTKIKSHLLNLSELVNGKEFLKDILLNSKDLSSVFHACCMVRKTAYEKVGMFYDERFGWYSDNDLWFRLLQEFDFSYINEVLIYFTGREANHILNDKSWDIIYWIDQIYKTNIERFFSDDIVNYEKANKLLQKKIEIASQKIFFQAILKGNNEFLIESCDKIKLYKSSKFLSVFSYFICIPFIRKIVLSLGQKLNLIRKRIFI